MPELPEVESVRRTLAAHLVGRRMIAIETSGLALRRPIDRVKLAEACVGARALDVRRHGKHLLIELSSTRLVIAHLGMTGRFTTEKPPPHTHATFRLEGGGALHYVDPRRFGVLYAARAGTELPGMDPFDPRFTAVWLAEALARSRRNLKSFLLDQTHLVGLGNIYVAEVLHAAGLSPRRRGRPAHAARLHRAIVDVLGQAIAHGGTTLDDDSYVDVDGRRGRHQEFLAAYGRAGQRCRRCGGTIRRLVQNARSTFYCPGCQR